MEGNFNETHPYSQSSIIIRARSYVNIAANTSLSISIPNGNYISAYCSLPSSALYYNSSHLVNSVLVPNARYRYINDNNTFSPFSKPIAFSSFPAIGKGCAHLKNCSGHGTCNYCLSQCICDHGYGSLMDVTANGRDISNSCDTSKCTYIYNSYMLFLIL